jgi:5-methylcytosine-specific restriction endonuclease McrA
MARKLTLRERLKQRAAGLCECGCGRAIVHSEMDHFFGRKNGESFEVCWLLHHECHRLKTVNQPSRGWWLRRFLRHCGRHGFADAAVRAMKTLEWIEAKGIAA